MKGSIHHKSEIYQIISVYKPNNLHIPVHIHDINPMLHASAADSHHQGAAPTHKTW